MVARWQTAVRWTAIWMKAPAASGSARWRTQPVATRWWSGRWASRWSAEWWRQRGQDRRSSCGNSFEACRLTESSQLSRHPSKVCVCFFHTFYIIFLKYNSLWLLVCPWNFVIIFHPLRIVQGVLNFHQLLSWKILNHFQQYTSSKIIL